MQETQVQSLSQEDPLEKGMAIPTSIFAWEIPWTYDPKAFHPLLRKHTQCTSKINTGPCFPPIRLFSAFTWNAFSPIPIYENLTYCLKAISKATLLPL